MSKFLKAISLVLAFSSPAFCAATLVQSKCYQGSGGEASHSLTFDGATQADSILMVFAATSGEALGVSATTDSYTNSWTQVGFNPGANSEVSLYYTTTTGRGASHLITVNPSGGNYIDMAITEWTGLTISSGNVAATGSATSTLPLVSLSPTDSALVFGGMEHENGTITITEDNTLICEDQDGTDYPFSVTYRTVAAGDTSLSWTMGGSALWRTAAVAFIESAGAAATPKGTLLGVLP